MKKATTSKAVAISVAALSLVAGTVVHSQQAVPEMSFFISSVGSGKGVDLGGLEGADRHCQSLATAAGAGKRKWRAYLSTTGTPAVNARERIGKGPWYSFEGRLIARNVDELHTSNNINRLVALNEKGKNVNGRADKPNTHDIITGSAPDGRASTDGKDTTCGNYTKSGEGAVLLGHHDRLGLRDDDAARSWNSSHPSRGCSQDNLVTTGGAGLIYCFAAN